MAVNWKKAEEYLRAGKGKKQSVKYAHNVYDEKTHTATSEMRTEVIVLDAKIIAVGDRKQTWLEVREAAGRAGWIKRDQVVILE